MDDEEIVKQFRNLHYEEFEKLPTEDIVEQKHFENAAIRLYRMAEKKTAEDLQETLRLAGIERESAIEQARASEREKCDKEYAALLMKELSPRIDKMEVRVNKAIAESYAKGKVEWAERHVKDTNEAFHHGYKKGQADLIDKLKKKYKFSTRRLRNIAYKIPGAYGIEMFGLLDRQRASLFATEEASPPHAANLPAGKLAVASESLGNEAAPDLAGTPNPKPKKPKTKRRNGDAKRL
jgi:hypothetical protein